MPVSTDLDTLRSVFTQALEGLEPRYQDGRAQRWRAFERRQPVTASARLFRLEWAADFPTPEGVMFGFMEDTTAPLAIVCDYGGVPDQISQQMINVDGTQIRRLFHALIATTPGLIQVRQDDPSWQFITENDGDQAQVEHLYLVRYWKRTR